ncbi:hypothetical protein BDZ89DRAFT_1039153 [Hymenopellis radicata]|nr:hypothetical protein BDZ89DRAFT_1039153 [Hymenopellis radicata]
MCRKGGGVSTTAEFVVAARLSENPDLSATLESRTSSALFRFYTNISGCVEARTYLVTDTSIPKRNRRSYDTSAFFTPNAERKNLSVLASALVQNLNTETGKTGLQLTSVNFSYGSDGTGQVKKEVILCAGSMYQCKLPWKVPTGEEHSVCPKMVENGQAGFPDR